MKKIAALTLVLILILALCACGGGKNPAIGTWEIKSVSDGTQTMSVDEVPTMRGFMVITLNEGGTGTITSQGETNACEWTDTTITVMGDRATYSISGDTMTLLGGSYIFVLTRK